MIRLYHLALAGCLVGFLTACGVSGQPVPAGPLHDLIVNPLQYDRQSVDVTGEVVGEIALQGSDGRVIIQSGPDAVAIWAPVGILSRIRHAGRRFVSGDTVRVSGQFFLQDPAHGGEQGILAHDIVLVDSGGRLKPQYEQVRAVLTTIAWFVGGIGTGVWIWRRKG